MAFSTVIQKKLLEKHHPLAVIGTGIAYGSLVSWPFGYDLFTVMDTWTMETHALVLYLAIFPSALAYLSWGVILQKVETHRATNLMYLIPFGTIFLEVLLLNESASAMAYIGGGVAFLGVVVAQISKTNNESCLPADT
jgi:drug/metabolite transporter (DMT)-like permease